MMLAAALLSVFVACQKPKIVEFSMSAQLEQPILDGDSNQKNYLTDDETYIRWELGDQIGLDNEDKSYPLMTGAGTDTAMFIGSYTDNEGNPDRYAIFPYRSKVDANITRLNFPAEQPYRSSGDVHQDHSFGRLSFPMVAWFKEESQSMLFHSVSSMMRIQLFATADKEIKEIKFEEVSATSKQISGEFTINSIKENAPYLTATESPVSSNSITITNINNTIGPDKLLTFYLVLPALVGPTPTNYKLKMTVTNKDGGTFVKSFGGNTNRNRITPIPALCIGEWSGEGSTCSINLSGNGTKDRPFMIYKASELQLVRNAFKAGTVVINGQTVSDETADNIYFQLARTDIVLNESNWNEGISNFKGHFVGKSNNPIEFGITNNSKHPIFESIAAKGEVSYLYVRGTSAYDGTEDFSPLCKENNGTLVNCKNHSSVTAAANLAGICVTNNGTIVSCDNNGDLTATGKNAAGVCIYNSSTGKIRSCTQGSASARYTVSKLGGICYENSGEIFGCKVSYNNNVSPNSAKVGGVVYLNKGGANIHHCFISDNLSLDNSASEFGGIVHTNQGQLDSCYVAGLCKLKAGKVGGLVCLQEQEVGKAAPAVWNGYNEGIIEVVGSGAGNYGGAIIAEMQAGKLCNCYAVCDMAGIYIAYIVGRVEKTTCEVRNCYAYVKEENAGSIFSVILHPEAETGVPFLNCYISNETLSGVSGCDFYRRSTWRVRDDSGLLSEKMTGYSWGEGDKAASWVGYTLPHFNF